MLQKIKRILIPNEFNRHKWVINKLSKLRENTTLLDAGCGTQQYKKYCNHLQYYGQDFGEYKPEKLKEGLQMDTWEYGKLTYIGNIWDIDEKDDSFDSILCTEVLEHIPYPNESIKEFSRLLKHNGNLILTAPYASLPHFQPYYYYSGFSKEWYEYILEKNGFRIVRNNSKWRFFYIFNTRKY